VAVPSGDARRPQRFLKLRAGVASPFVAGLDLARDGAVRLDQVKPFSAILLHLSTAPEFSPEVAADQPQTTSNDTQFQYRRVREFV